MTSETKTRLEAKKTQARQTEAMKARRSGPRKHRARPVPKWLKEQKEMDDVARRRCLMILGVLSGHKPVTDAITEVQMSRATYYKLEERALRAMLAAVSPQAGPDGGDGAALDLALCRVEELEAQVVGLQREKRRLERLTLMTKKLIKAGPLTVGTQALRGRRRRRKSPKRISTKETTAAAPSTPSKTGATAS